MSIEAMKKLVAAVEAIPEELEDWMPDALTDALIDAKKAISDFEKQEPVGEMVAWPNDFERVGVDWISYVPEVGTKLYTHPQPKQEQGEPVENRFVRELREYGKTNQGAYLFPSWDIHRALKYLDGYTHPQPKREWVGLTDEDRQAAFESMPDMLEGFLKKWGWLHFSKAIEAKLKQKNGLTSKPQEELSKLTVADDINQLCMMGELPIQFEDLADWVADGKWPVNIDAQTKQLVETLLRALENEQDRNRLADVCVDATDAAVQLGRQYLGLVNKQEGVV